MAEFQLDSNIETVINQLSDLIATMPEQLQPYNQEIMLAMEEKVRELYGPKLAAFFDITENAGTSGVASVHVGSTDYRVIGYEFGTRAHDIRAHGRALMFIFRGEIMYRQYVRHPGDAPRDRRFELETALSDTALTTWTQALTDILETLNF